MKLVVDPVRGLVDEPPRLMVTDIPGEEGADHSMRLTIAGVDAAGHVWRSVGHYPIGADGLVRLDDPDRPWWAMQFVDRGCAPVAFAAPDTSWRCTVTAECAGELAYQTVYRDYGDQPRAGELSGPGWRLRIYAPDDERPRPAVLIVPGSAGVEAMAPAAALLASRGYLAAILSYMGEPGLPDSFQRIPVETLGQSLTALRAAPGVDRTRLAVWAVSLGTALALAGLTGRDAPAVRGVIAFSPTSVIWQAPSANGRPPRTSSLTRDGTDLPWLPVYGQRLRGQLWANKVGRWFSRSRSNALALLPAYGPALEEESAENAAIAVEKIDAPLLAVAGDSDAVWPSAMMATDLIARRQRHGRTDDRLLLLPHAGHFLRPPATPATVNRNHDVISGGTPEGIAHGQREAWRSTLDFLAATVAV